MEKFRMLRRLGAISLCLMAEAASGQQTPYRIETIAGSSFTGDNGPAVSAYLQQAEGVALDRQGNLFVADAAAHRVRKVSALDGIITTVAGNGSPGFSGDGGPATGARLNAPYGLALDRDGALYICDLGNRRVRRVNPNGRIETVAGGGAIPAGESANGSLATVLRFETPRNVLVDTDGGLLLSDFDANTVYRITPSGIVTIFTGTGRAGAGLENELATRSALRAPAGLALDGNGAVLIADSGNQRIRRVYLGLASTYKTPVLYSPTGIAFDGSQNLYIADARQGAALKRTASGQYITLPSGGSSVAAGLSGNAYFTAGTVVNRIDPANRASIAAGAGEFNFTGDQGAADAAYLGAPSGLTQDASGNLYIADEARHRIRRITPGGIITTIAGDGTAGYRGDGGPALAARLNAPRGLSFDRYGNLLVADSQNSVIRRIAVNGVITTFAGSGIKGFAGDGGPATAAQLREPSDVKTDSLGEIYIADTGNQRIRKVTASGILFTYAGNGANGYGGDGNLAPYGQLSNPRGLALDAQDNLYIADTGNNRLRRVDRTGLITSIGEAPYFFPRSVSVDPGGTIFIADTGHHQVLRIPADVSLNVAAGIGTPGFSGDGGSSLQAELQFPAAVLATPSGIFVADLGNHRVRKLTPGDTLAPAALPSSRLLNAASLLETPVSVGMLVTLYGSGWSTEKDTLRMLWNGAPSKILFASESQINAEVPESVGLQGSAAMQLFSGADLVLELKVPLAPAGPALFRNFAEPGLGIGILEDGTVNSALNPAPRAGIVTIYVTGEGRGLPLTASMGGRSAEILYSAPVPDFPGMVQLNLRVPGGFFAAGTMDVIVSAGTYASPSGTFLYVR